MNIQSIIILAVIILVCFLICRNLYKKSKNGEFSCGGIFSTMAFLVRLLVKPQIKVCNLFWLISLKHLHKWLLISFQLL